MDKDEMIHALIQAAYSMYSVFTSANLSLNQKGQLKKSADKIIDIAAALEGRPNENEPVPPNPQAFPVLADTPTGLDCTDVGMTLRDYFAGKVMQGVCSITYWAEADDAIVSRHAYQRADAMLKERNKEDRDSSKEIQEAFSEMLAVLKDLAESAAYWGEYDVPIGIVDRINAAIKKAEGCKNEEQKA
jgi:hypothetical protein